MIRMGTRGVSLIRRLSAGGYYQVDAQDNRGREQKFEMTFLTDKVDVA